MRPFPEDYELVGFFEVEPTVLDKDIPWAYNELTFKTESSNGVLETRMITGSEIMDIKWHQNNELILHLNLVGVRELKIDSGCTKLIANFRSGNVKPLVVKVRPFICVEWGYNDHV